MHPLTIPDLLLRVLRIIPLISYSLNLPARNNFQLSYCDVRLLLIELYSINMVAPFSFESAPPNATGSTVEINSQQAIKLPPEHQEQIS